MIGTNPRGLALLLVVLVLTACGGGRPNVSTATGSGPPPVTLDDEPIGAVHRYALANQCFALRSTETGRYVTYDGSNYRATGQDIASAIGFFMKPASLGEYLLYHFFSGSERALLSSDDVPTQIALENATDLAVFVLRVLGDATVYPTPLQYDTEPTPAAINSYRNFNDPFLTGSEFTFANRTEDKWLAVDASDALVMLAQPAGDEASFSFERLDVTSCAIFPEALSNIEGELDSPLGLQPSFSGTWRDEHGNDNVLGHADVHVHWSSSTFLGNAQAGYAFHEYGVTHALGECSDQHGERGEKDGTGIFFTATPNHDTTGWPTFPDWPARNALTHEAMYWKWVERAWQAGLRIMVNDLVDNDTLCELQRNVTGEDAATTECNSMNSAADQVGTMYALQDYIDAQYGGRGRGFMRIVLDPAEARREVEAGNMAVVLGLEISNTLGCKVIYSPTRTEDAWQESGAGGIENAYTCTEADVITQLDRLWALGVRQFISIHEFDNAFGGNGIFMDILNAGNRENSGGIPFGAESGGFQTVDEGTQATGEFWSTYDCPVEGVDGFDYFWGSKGGERLPEAQSGSPDNPPCVYAGQPDESGSRRPGGSTPCYPATQQCNARWMTPRGLFTFMKLMEYGFIFDFDHFELEMKTQALELAEAQPLPYPFVSTHGTFGGISVEQAKRVFANGGFLFPSIGSSDGFLKEMNEAKGVFDQAMENTHLPPAEQLFAFGYGTDTNGLSGQSSPRPTAISDVRPLGYPFALFEDRNDVCVPETDTVWPDSICRDYPAFWRNIAQFSAVPGVIFQYPAIYDPADPENTDGDDDFIASRKWHDDDKGNEHYGMFSDMVQELRLADFDAASPDRGNIGSPEQAMRYLFSSAELYLRTWERTLEASARINTNGGAVTPGGILRPAPVPVLPGYQPGG